MARRATSLTKGRAISRETAPVDLPEQGAKAQRGGQKGKRRDLSPIEMSVTDAFFPGGDEMAASVADPVASEPAKARRGRKPKMQPAPEAPPSDEKPTPEINQPATDNAIAESDAASDMVADDVLRSNPTPISPHADASAVRWSAETGTATFDWPIIEQVAASDGPNQAMAKLLLAARDEGANSRWPF